MIFQFRWDIICCEDDDWKEKAGVEALQHGSLQPFYHILVDEQDWTANNQESLVAYVAQEKLLAPQVGHKQLSLQRTVATLQP